MPTVISVNNTYPKEYTVLIVALNLVASEYECIHGTAITRIMMDLERMTLKEQRLHPKKKALLTEYDV